MAPSPQSPEASFRLLLKSDDRLPRDLQDLDRAELESLRTAVESTLSRLTPPEQEAVGLKQEAGFFCEWWPPD